MGFFGKISLCLLFLSCSYILPSSSKIGQCDSAVLAANETREFGSHGNNGNNGERGQNAQNTQSTTVFADGSPARLNLAGQNGGEGKNGQNGADAKCVDQPQDVTHNLRATNGGNGGNGGDGGDGGNGGDLTVYTTNPANLRQITVNTVGGQGGQPGLGGKGGKGCQCSRPYWTVQTCRGRPGSSNYRCTTETFQCQNGLDGIDGTQGRVGRDGRLGQLTLISLNRPLVDDKPSATVALSELKDRGFTLSKNKWETRTGALSLFAPGSVIDDQYRIMVERLEHSFLLTWNAPQSFDKFAAQRMTLSLEDNQQINVNPPSQVWLEATTKKDNNMTQFVVYNAILEKEVTDLVSQGIAGNRADFQLTLEDKADLSNLIATKFEVRYRTTRSDPRFRQVSDYRTQYEGFMPPELINQQGNKFIFNMGKLPLDPENFRPGLGFEIEVIATRSFGGYSKQQTIIVRDIIPGLR
ncbi:conserved hypothetical protein [Gloeothece citriformis PCC 7424]|uniref:Uncharacterized protein n=1 Tax=Gloeothece citriformis (strain PCC 7424) TaxID=65393 RepID=B7KDB7_GLOC7|nr:hypothetical protein [Gloeothece citriformis]ACK68937.1 conserved hypothetical protein [Gloeothece citriformis PCC 7424]